MLTGDGGALPLLLLATTKAGGRALRALLVGLLGELGDKSFYLLLILSAWCPWQGLRSGRLANVERAALFAGAVAALDLRAICLVALRDPLQWGFWPHGLAAALLLALGTRAALERRRGVCTAGGEDNPFLLPKEDAEPQTWNQSAFAARLPSKGGGEEDEESSAAREPRWNNSAFQMPNRGGGEEAPDYGAAPAPAAPPRAALAELVEGRVAGAVLAFPLAFGLVFLTEAEDKSEAALADLGDVGAVGASGLLLSVFAGSLPAVALAVFLGFLLERQLERQTATLLVAFVLLSLGLTSLSQALLHVAAPKTPRVAPAAP